MPIFALFVSAEVLFDGVFSMLVSLSFTASSLQSLYQCIRKFSNNIAKKTNIARNRSTVCKGSVFLQFCDKIQPSMRQIFTKMYLTVSIGTSHMKSPMELFMFLISGQPPHLNLPIKISLSRYLPFEQPTTLPPSPKQGQETHESSL